MPDIRGLMGDPGFKALSPQRQRAVLRKTGAKPEFIRDFQRLQISRMGEKNARELSPAPPPDADHPRAGLPRKGASFGDFQAWRQDAMGDLGRMEPQTSEEAEAGGKGAATGLAATAALAAPMTLARMLGGGATGIAADQATDKGLRAMGVSPGTADIVGDVVGTVVAGATTGGAGVAGSAAAQGAKRKGGKLLNLVFGKGKAKPKIPAPPKLSGNMTEAQMLKASADMRVKGHTQKQIDEALSGVTRKAAPGVTSGAVSKAKPLAAPASTKPVPVKPAPPTAKADEDVWRVAVVHGKYKGQGGVKIKHGMGSGQTRPGGGTGSRTDVIRLDNGTEVSVPATSVLTDFGKRNHSSVQKAIDASRAGSKASSAVTKEATKFADSVRQWKKQGFSEGQMVDSLRQVHGFKTAKEARGFIRLVMGGS